MKTKMWKGMMAAVVILPMMMVSCTDIYVDSITGHGEVVQATLDLDDFDGFINTVSADIYLTQGETQEVVIEAQENIIDNIELDRVNGGIWTIKYDKWVRYAKPVKIFITIPTLTKASITGSGTVYGETAFTGLDRLVLAITGSGDMDIESESSEMDVLITGSGSVTLRGTTGPVDILISGSGTIRAFDLQATETDITVSGSGDARVNVEQFLKVLITGSGNVFYRGEPTVDSRISGSGGVYKDR